MHGSAANCDGTRFPSIFVRLDEPDVLRWIYQNVFPERVQEIDECDSDYDYDCGMYKYYFKIVMVCISSL